jgi:hypothetical protein
MAGVTRQGGTAEGGCRVASLVSGRNPGSGSSKETPPSKQVLRAAVLESLEEQGFVVSDGAIIPAADAGKDAVRALHAAAVSHAVEKSRHNLIRHEKRLLGYLAEGATLDPKRIEPRLVEVAQQSEEELLFRYARLHWRVPTSAGYGRRLRFLVMDEHNDKLIGLIGLGDGVFSLTPRDEWVGWDLARRKVALRGMMDAHILGAVPPYSQLLGSKLVALLAASVDVREAFAERYAGRETVISGTQQDGHLALITTTGAFGRSSVYNRLRYRAAAPGPGRLVFEPVGFSKGAGQFHFANDLYAMLKAYAVANCKPSSRSASWGTGFRNRREVIEKALAHLGLNPRTLGHGVPREILCAPLARNAKAFLRGEELHLESFQETAEEFSQFWRERWLQGRSLRDARFREFVPASWQLWDHEPKRRGRPPKYGAEVSLDR